MRIISQDNETNVPYDLVTIDIDQSYNNYEILASPSNADAAWTVLGEYSTYGKAITVFEHIILHGNADRQVFRMPKDSEVNE